MRIRFLVIWLLLITTLSLGCSPDGPKLHKVTGKVTVDGQPAQSAMVMFTPADGSLASVADVKVDGTYELTLGGTRSGAVAGSHTVKIVRIEGGSVEEGEQPAAPSNVPPKYGDDATSGLKAEVKEEDNVIDFDLKTQ